MQLAICHVRLSPGQEVAKYNVTPSELLVLKAVHDTGSGGQPIHHLKLVGEVKRPKDQELNRLRRHYANARHRIGDKDVSTVEALFGGFAFRMPDTFAELGDSVYPGIANLPLANKEETRAASYTPGHNDEFVDADFDKPVEKLPEVAPGFIQ